ncbi:unnamed protein product [Chrysodeixis includens]|uniref:DNA endonuclease RBBP8 n=1 Tax=Chrysodeixis includens TaxID=689277 RepID=A0A9N8KVS7_CHRIL|nr:unnamed protein product [Chrysodeixis includens]
MSNHITTSFSSVITNNVKVLTLEKTLEQSLQDFKEVLTDLEQLHITSNNYKTQYIKQKEKCESNSCSSAEILKKVIEAKDNIIQSVASTLTKLVETKDFQIIDNIFKILFGEIPTTLNEDNLKNKDSKKVSPINIKKEVNSSNEDLSFNDDSVSEIEGTPTGRSSPIIQTKKMKTTLVNTSDVRDKKKCPESWPTPETKALKLTFSTPVRGSKQSGKMRQARLNIVKMKERQVIDITCSPEFSGGSRSKNGDGNVQPLIKKESMENDDTIQPSPTSGPTSFTLFKSRESPMKFKKPQLSLKIKTESKTPKKQNQNVNTLEIKQEPHSENKFICNLKMNDSVTFTQDDSINILNPKRLPTNFGKCSPVKYERCDDETYCDTQSSISLLNHVEELANIHEDIPCSPSKRPLAENINVTNMPDDVIQPSLSILQREAKTSKLGDENVRRKIPEFLDNDDPIRRKADKRLLPGWSCDKCKEFFGELYKDDPEMMAKKINECSHHRGVNNPNDRPKTPPGFWNPRWNVPDNTEEFNRMNNVT